MANITFASPRMAKDVTVYAVAGDRGTILAIAKQHKIPIPFDCQDGECGSCIVKVSHLDATTKYSTYGIALTEKEKELLKQLGKITKDEIFKTEIIHPLARWTRARWGDVCDTGVAFMAHIEENLPILREALQEPRNDAAFIANMLRLGASAVDMELQDEVQGMLRSLARR